MFAGEYYIPNDFVADEPHLEDADLTTLRAALVSQAKQIKELETRQATIINILKALIPST